eukprot:scaffold125380_cov57-Phaeocystis_antarctica.AAC.5
MNPPVTERNLVVVGENGVLAAAALENGILAAAQLFKTSFRGLQLSKRYFGGCSCQNNISAAAATKVTHQQRHQGVQKESSRSRNNGALTSEKQCIHLRYAYHTSPVVSSGRSPYKSPKCGVHRKTRSDIYVPAELGKDPPTACARKGSGRPGCEGEPVGRSCP